MIRNIAVMAHVDTGKTTLTEQMLRHCGAIRTVGSVDEGTAHTDRLEVERRRGISVHAACVPMRWRNTEINLIDTPGHTDFSAEVERSLWALDGAVLLISAVDGVLPQTEKLFQTLRKLRLPVVIFLNKTDREGADVDAVLRQARERLHAGVTACTPEALMERIAEQDEAALEDYLNGTLWPAARLLPTAAAMTRSGELIPALAGSALKDQGVEALLDALVDFLPPPEGDADAPLCGVVFGVEMDKTMGRAALTRMFSGRLCNRDMIGDSKVTQIRMLTVEGRPKDAGELRAGEIGVIYGLSNVRAGDVLGDPALLPRRLPRGELCDPLMMVKVLCDPARKVELRAALEQLSVEDGHFTHEELEGVEHIRVMGLIQLEVLQELLSTRFGLAVTFDKPTVVYRETIAKEAVGFYAYTMPKPCWAVLKFLITPLPRGSGVQYESVTPVREIMERYQHQVEQAISPGDPARHAGLAGGRCENHPHWRGTSPGAYPSPGFHRVHAHRFHGRPAPGRLGAAGTHDAPAHHRAGGLPGPSAQRGGGHGRGDGGLAAPARHVRRDRPSAAYGLHGFLPAVGGTDQRRRRGEHGAGGLSGMSLR